MRSRVMLFLVAVVPNLFGQESAGRPIPAMDNPVEIFGRMFGATTVAERNALASRGSVIGEILSEAKDLNRRFDASDRRKMDEYLSSVREVEKMTERAVKWQGTPKSKVDAKELDLSVNVTAPREYLTVMYDLMALAFQTYNTRVASFQTASEEGGLTDRTIRRQHCGYYRSVRMIWGRAESGIRHTFISTCRCRRQWTSLPCPCDVG